ncbi:MAG: HAMP domain-containing histidine kinase [Lachnospiraceae bacterium]|nr:HAMP domain-containing histidine kinase [Lachnospiraceae bacterium]
MNADAIRKLRMKFISISMVSLFITMIFISDAINLANYVSSIQLVRQVLYYIVQNDGEVSPRNEDREIGRINSFSGAFQPQYWHYQYFSCICDAQGNVSSVINHLDAQNDGADLIQYAETVFQENGTFGTYEQYYYQTGTTSDGSDLVVFVDGTMEISTITRLFYWTLMICGLGLVITFVLVWFLSKKMIQPEIENSRRQKQFITNASHELKTPLAVIRANVELEEMMNGESELSQSTLRQVDHMNGLIQNLVMIARSEEKEDKTGMTDVDVSKLVEESAQSFSSVATQGDRKLILQIEPDIHRILNGSKVQQLTTILVDNAIKYCDEGGTIRVSLSVMKWGKSIQLAVSNSYAEGANVDYNRFFDRFYREDQSHNIDKGGYGIGLSIAESICKQSGGTIRAEWKDGEISFICKL